MRVTLLPSCFPNATGETHQHLTSFLINQTLAVDAGAIGFAMPLADQARIQHVLLSHTHMDHIASLPVFIENTYRTCPDCVVVHGSAAALDVLQRDIFNGRIWPDFVVMGGPHEPFLRFEELRSGEMIELEGLQITPVRVNHTVPTLGFIIDDRSAAIVIASDTGPTDEIWDRANKQVNLKAVFLEVSFPEVKSAIAIASKHMTPAMFAADVGKLKQPVQIFAVHLKARYHAQVAAELAARAMPQVTIAQPGRMYEF